MALPHGVRFKATDIWDTPEDGNRYEVIDGVLYVSPPPSATRHQRPLGRLYVRVAVFVEANHLGELLIAPVGVVLDAGTGVQPDIVFVRRERLHIITDREIAGAPDLIVEALSPSTRGRDRGIKLRRYAAAGVPHYWMLDPRTEALEARRLTGRGYELLGVYGPGTVFRPELFPGLEIAIDELWT